MIAVSNSYKEIMNRPIRNRAYISIGIGIINQEAQEDADANGDFAYWSYGNIFDANQNKVEYATLEENYMRADGKMYFVPENTNRLSLKNNGITTDEFLGEIKITFNNIYAIKGLTIEFGSAYPTSFTVKVLGNTFTYTNSEQKFTTTDVMGDTNYIIISPLAMHGGKQRFRIKSILMGVGLQYSNKQTKKFEMQEYISPIMEDLSSKKISYSFYDEDNYFDVNDNNSFIGFLETMQPITVSFGLELDDKSVEWKQVATQYLKEWKSQKGIVAFDATDRLSHLEDDYKNTGKFYTRTAFKEAENIFTDAGMKQSEYAIDERLKNITLLNPMPEGTHKECLQLLANACGCIIKNDASGKIVIEYSLLNDFKNYTSEDSYVLLESNMLEKAIGYKEKRVKSVRVKVFTYKKNEIGEVEEVDDNIFVEKQIGLVGEVKTLKNQLVHTQEMASKLANWLGNYYMSGISYDVKYRGEPRISASDVIKMESNVRSNLQTIIIENKLNFDGCFSGELTLKKISE